MLLNSLLVALLLSDAASEPQLRGTSVSDVSEGASPDIIERAAVYSIQPWAATVCPARAARRLHEPKPDRFRDPRACP